PSPRLRLGKLTSLRAVWPYGQEADLCPLISSRAKAAPSSLPPAGDDWTGPWQFRRALRPCVPWMPEPRRAPPRPRQKRRYLVLSNWRRQPGHLARDFVSRAPEQVTSGVASSPAHRAPAFPPVLLWRRPPQ